MSLSMLKTGEIWLYDAVEIVAIQRWPKQWADYLLSEGEALALNLFNEDEARFNAYVREQGAGLSGLGMGNLGALAWRGPPPEKPEQTLVVYNADHKRTLANKLLSSAWTELRRALVDGQVVAHCMMALEPNDPIPDEEWGKDANHDAYLNKTVFLGLSPSTGKPRYGKAFLRLADLNAYLGCAEAAESSLHASETGGRVNPKSEATAEELTELFQTIKRLWNEHGRENDFRVSRNEWHELASRRWDVSTYDTRPIFDEWSPEEWGPGKLPKPRTLDEIAEILGLPR